MGLDLKSGRPRTVDPNTTVSKFTDVDEPTRDSRFNMLSHAPGGVSSCSLGDWLKLELNSDLHVMRLRGHSLDLYARKYMEDEIQRCRGMSRCDRIYRVQLGHPPTNCVPWEQPEHIPLIKALRNTCERGAPAILKSPWLLFLNDRFDYREGHYWYGRPDFRENHGILKQQRTNGIT